MKTSFVKSIYWANKFVNYQPLAVWSARAFNFSYCGRKFVSPTLQTSQFRDFKELYLLVVFNKSQLGNNINLKALFLAEMTKFLNLSMWVEETVEVSIGLVGPLEMK